MNIIVKKSESVKATIAKNRDLAQEQEQVQNKLAEKFGHQEYRKNLHQHSAEKFARLNKDLEDIQIYINELEQKAEENSKRPLIDTPEGGIQLSLRYEEVDDLPEEVLSELSLSDSDKADYQIRSLMEELGGIASLDRLIVGIYRQTGEVMKRNTITSKLYRMISKGVIFSVPGRKGVYSLEDLSEEEAEQLIKGKQKISD